ncbi:reverse transcriptase [Hordeum vulgare]|nr:reverse transcriptase [Hordeum vulgare]
MIRYRVDEVRVIVQAAGCAIKELPITYLGLPLPPCSLTRAELQPLIDRIAAQLPTWKVVLLRRAGRLTLVNCKLLAMPIFQLMRWTSRHGSSKASTS